MPTDRGETLADPQRPKTSSGAPGGAAARDRSRASAWSIRPRSSPPRASSARNTVDLRRRRRRCASSALRDGRARGLRLTFDDRARHRRHRAGAEGRLHHRQRPRPRPQRRQAAVQRVRTSAPSRARARASRSRDGTVNVQHAWSPIVRSERRRRRRAARSPALAASAGLERDDAGRVALVATETGTNL